MPNLNPLHFNRLLGLCQHSLPAPANYSWSPKSVSPIYFLELSLTAYMESNAEST